MTAPLKAVEGSADLPALMRDLASGARAAARTLALASSPQKDAALKNMAAAIRDNVADILAANADDVADARAAGATTAYIDRLTLTDARIAAMADGIDVVREIADPVGAVTERWQRPNGMTIERVRVPIGVVGVIFESRPNVAADAGALCLKSGNAVILRGGSDSFRSCRAIHRCLAEGLRAAALPEQAITLVPLRDREAVGLMLSGLNGGIDVIVPRGGKSLVARVEADARVPVFAHLEGVNHVYVDAAADPDMAKNIVLNAKMRRTGVCGAAETLLIDKAAQAHIRPLVEMLIDAGCEVRGDAVLQKADARVKPATDDDWSTEYLDAIIAAKVVDGIHGAIAHIERYGSHHTDAIVTEDAAKAEKFLSEVDSAIVLHNASTQFADGGEFGFGAEIGIATGRFHARGPVGAEQLTSFKYRVHGSGQTRPVTASAARHTVPVTSDGMRISLLGGSFNPPHEAHRAISLFALKRLRLDRVWWLVSPGNPLKDTNALPPLERRMEAAEKMARDRRIIVSGCEATIGTRYTFDTISFLRHHRAHARFVWIMGADNLAQFHLWESWRSIAELVPIAVVDRPPDSFRALASPAAQALASTRVDEQNAATLASRAPPAWVFLTGMKSDLSSTRLRHEDGS